MIADLEACASLHLEIEHALRSDDWHALSLRPDWKRVQEICLQSSEELLIDALWAANGAFRHHGERRTTFAKRCADPSFAERYLEVVRVSRAKLERLLAEVSDQPFCSDLPEDPLARAQAELCALREADAELRLFRNG